MQRGADRLVHCVAIATVWAWAASLCGAWGRLLGMRPPVMWVAAAAALTAFAIGLVVPSQILRAAARLVRMLDRRAMFGMPPVEPNTPRPPQHVSRLLGVSLILAAAGSVLSALILLAAGSFVGWVAAGFLLPPAAIRGVHFIVLTIAMGGWGIGAGLVYHAHLVVLGHGNNPDGPGTEPIDWLAGLAVASAVIALLWRRGGDPVAVGLLIGLVQLGLGLLLLRRRRAGSVASRQSPASVAVPSIRLHVGVVARAAAVTAVMAAQMRALADLLGVTLGDQVLLAGTSVLLMATFHSRWADRHFIRPGHASAGAAVLAAAAVVCQMTLALVALAAGPSGQWLVWLALAAQIPLAAAAVIVSQTQRKRFMAAGGSSRHWMQWMLIGLALGCLGGAVGLGAVDGRPPTMLALLAVLAAAILVGIGVSRRAGRQFVWTIAGGALLLAATVGLAAAATYGRRSNRHDVAAGAWLTAFQQDGRCGYLPAPARPSNARLDLLAGRMLMALAADADRVGQAAAVPGSRWLIVTQRPVLDPNDIDLTVDVAAADPAIAAMPAWYGRQAGDLFATMAARAVGYHGILYAPLPADHPAARAVYNRDALAWIATRLAPEGVLLIHVSCHGPNAAPVAAVARTVDHLFGSWLAAVRVDGDDVELLILARVSQSDRWSTQAMSILAEQLGEDASIVRGADMAPLIDPAPLVHGALGAPCGDGAFIPTGSVAAFIRPASVGQDF